MFDQQAGAETHVEARRRAARRREHVRAAFESIEPEAGGKRQRLPPVPDTRTCPSARSNLQGVQLREIAVDGVASVGGNEEPENAPREPWRMCHRAFNVAGS